MKAWRLVAPHWTASAFDGEGAQRYGGRWNSEGTAVVYLASSLALAALELLIHIDYERALEPYVAIPVAFDEALLLNVPRENLPENWAEPEGLPTTQAIGDTWVRRNASALLAVPSRVVAAEQNYLFNPNHPDAEQVMIGEAQPFSYDPRLLKR